MLNLKNILFSLICLAFVFSSRAQKNQSGDNLNYTDSAIHTVLFHNEGWEFSLPVLEAGSSQRLILKFDELSGKTKSYSYTLTHCDYGWNQSRLMTSEYMDGFQENPLNDYAFSVNTTIPYVNYRLALPNDQVKILVSGNYLLKVWDNTNKEKPVLIRPFYVAEKLAEIAGGAGKAAYEGYNGASQQIAFTVNFIKLEITDPLNEISASVMQNSRIDNMHTKLRPTYIRQNQLVYEDNVNVFSGGNEFRNFNAKNLQTNGMGVHSIEYRDPYYHLFLERDQSQRKEIYRFRDDLNGKYLVKNDRATDSDLESDYICVHFSLTPPDQVTNDQIYVFGSLSDWQCAPVNLMNYNPETKLYELTMLLKQGFYDYQYVVFDKEKKMADATLLEGSHLETENDYHLFVYYRGFSSRYDRLIGYRVFNSVKGR